VYYFSVFQKKKKKNLKVYYYLQHIINSKILFFFSLPPTYSSRIEKSSKPSRIAKKPKMLETGDEGKSNQMIKNREG